MKKDIATGYDIEKLVIAFYGKLKTDKTIGPYFAQTDWNRFLPIAKAFWENVLFFTGHYDGNPMEIHKEIHERMSLSPKIFKHWLEIFSQTVNELYKGEKAELIKQKANNIATVMQVKILK